MRLCPRRIKKAYGLFQAVSPKDCLQKSARAKNRKESAMSEGKKKKVNIAAGIWLIVLLLAILVLATAILVASFVKRYVGGEKNVIAVVIDGNAIREQYDDPELPLGANPDMQSGEPAWETETTVDLFKNTYVNADGVVTVKSALGDKVIAPGTSHSYDFTLKNTGNISLDYTLSVDSIFKISGYDLPFYVRLRCNGEWLVGKADKWEQVETLGDSVDSRTLARDSSVTYTFEWQWPFESDEKNQQLLDNFNQSLLEADANDTGIGNYGGADTDFTLTISTTAVVTPGADAMFRDGTLVLHEFILVIVLLGLILGALIWLLILLLLRRKIYLTGIVVPAIVGEVGLGKKQPQLYGNRFVFSKVRMGKRVLTMGETVCKLKFRSGKSELGVVFEQQDETVTVTLRRGIRALELYFDAALFTPSTLHWAAIDKKHNVYTASGVRPPDPETKTNTTPDGLTVDKNGKYNF